MKVAIITDQHFGARKNSKLFHDYFLKFYNDIFFPYLEENGITTIVDMGDTFDNRTGINFSSLAWAKDNYYDRLSNLGVRVYTVVGNHTAYYKNTNSINAVDLLLREYDNIHVVSEYEEIKLDNLKVGLIPWIDAENEAHTYSKLKKTKCPVVMGHLELSGFMANQNHVMEHGADRNPYKKFDKVFSGHYHHRSSQDNIHYLGNPYEIYWNDVNETRGFHVFDTETLEHTPINNPYRMFYKISYNDDNYQTFDARPYKDKIVKILVNNKGEGVKFEKFVDKLYQAGVFDLKIIESIDYDHGFVTSEDHGQDTEDTLSLLSKYIDEIETQVDKSKVKELFQTVYKEACEVE